MADRKPTTGPRKLAAVLGALLIAALLAGGAFYNRSMWIGAGNVGIVYNANGGLDRSHVIEPHRVFVGWRQRIYEYPTSLQNALYSQDPDAGEVKTADGIAVTTRDNQNTMFDISVIYRVRRENVFKAFDNFGPIPIGDVQRLHIRRALKEAVNSVGTQYDVFDLMGAKRLEASDKLTAELRRLLDYKGLTIERAMFEECEPGADLQNKINARVNAYTDLEISRLKAKIADIDRQTAVVLAKAQSQARALSASTTQGSSFEMLQLEASQEAIKRWNGSLPPIQARPGQTLVIGRELIDAAARGQR